MRENRTCGSEGGEAQSLPYPYPGSCQSYSASLTTSALSVFICAHLWFSKLGSPQLLNRHQILRA